jgi:hypothetical protein
MSMELGLLLRGGNGFSGIGRFSQLVEESAGMPIIYYKKVFYSVGS